MSYMKVSVHFDSFTGFCLRFADDFEVSWDDWKPDSKLDVVMNAMVVPEGTYEVCSRTINAIPNNPNSNAKWILNVLWLVSSIYRDLPRTVTWLAVKQAV